MSADNRPTNEQRLRIAYGLLVLAPLVFTARAAFAINGIELVGWPLAVAGILSGAGMLVALAATWKGPEFLRAAAAVAVALGGHYLIGPTVDSDLGGAMVYLGTGFLVSLRIRWAQYGALVAGIGALMRGELSDMAANSILMVGTLTIAAALVLGAMGRKTPPRPSRFAKPTKP